jgi:hypothetical protein
MPRKKTTFGDMLRGWGMSARSGSIGDPFKTQRYVSMARDERLASQVGRTAFGSSDHSEIARRAFREAQQQRGRDLQYQEDGVTVRVKNGYSRRGDGYTTDVILIDPGRPGEHLHIVFDERGNKVHEKWTRNH